MYNGFWMKETARSNIIYLITTVNNNKKLRSKLFTLPRRAHGVTYYIFYKPPWYTSAYYLFSVNSAVTAEHFLAVWCRLSHLFQILRDVFTGTREVNTRPPCPCRGGGRSGGVIISKCLFLSSFLPIYSTVWNIIFFLKRKKHIFYKFSVKSFF